MNFEPFDTSLIMEHVRASVPELQAIGGAADYAAVRELRSFRTPSVYVIFAEDTNTRKIPASIGVASQEALISFGVVLAMRHYGERAGGQMSDQMGEQARRLIGQVRSALIGYRPASPGARVVDWLGGAVLDYDASVLLFADRYQLHHLLHKGACEGRC